MQYFGVPKCPYCKKRVNIIRVWSLKKHGEFKCPRCEGISNIYLSPLVYVAAILAVAAGILIYFFERFVTDTISPMTCLKILIPFAVFFIVSLFFVYLEKPVIRRVRRTSDGRFIDENGNEMKMKMGKLVSPAAGNTRTGRVNPNSENTGYVRNDRDMTGRNDPRPTRTAVDRPKAENSDKYYTNSSFADDEELYARAAAKRRSSAETNSGRRLNALSTEYDEETVKNVTVNDDDVKTYVRKPAAERPMEQPVARPQRTQPQPETVRRPAESSVRPKTQDDGTINAGRIASERNSKSARPNSGFEDIIDTYATKEINTERPVRRREENTGTHSPRPAHRGETQTRPRVSRSPERKTPEKHSGGTRFRDL